MDIFILHVLTMVRPSIKAICSCFLGLSSGVFLINLIGPMQEEELPRLDDTGALVIVCDANPNQMIILDSNGKWLSSVRNVEFKIDINNSATITCIMWNGPIRPTNPKIETWQLSQLKSVAENDFKSIVDSLQKDPEAIHNMLMK